MAAAPMGLPWAGGCGGDEGGVGTVRWDCDEVVGVGTEGMGLWLPLVHRALAPNEKGRAARARGLCACPLRPSGPVWRAALTDIAMSMVC